MSDTDEDNDQKASKKKVKKVPNSTSSPKSAGYNYWAIGIMVMMALPMIIVGILHVRTTYN